MTHMTRQTVSRGETKLACADAAAGAPAMASDGTPVFDSFSHSALKKRNITSSAT